MLKPFSDISFTLHSDAVAADSPRKEKSCIFNHCKINENINKTSMKDVQQQHFFTGSLRGTEMYFAYFVFFS